MNSHPPTAYIAGKYKGTWTPVAFPLVKNAGFIIPYDWRIDLRPNKPFVQPNQDSPLKAADNVHAAQDMLDYAYACSLFVLVAEENIYGAMTELGAALTSRLTPNKRIIVTFPPGVRRESIFFSMNGVEVVEWKDLPEALTRAYNSFC